MPPRAFLEWMEYADLEPFGSPIDDRRSLWVGLAGGGAAPEFKTFFPHLCSDEAEQQAALTPEETVELMKCLARAWDPEAAKKAGI